MNSIKVLLLGAVLLGGAARAADDVSPAGFYIEPGISYQFAGSEDITYPAPLNSGTGNLKGLGILARVGFHVLETAFVGVDGRYGRLSLKDETNGFDSTGSAYNWGLTAGLQMPITGLRAWAGWILGGAVDPDASGAVDFKYGSGAGWRLGAGFHVLTFSLNLEYQQITYDDLQLQQLGPFSPGVSVAGNSLVDKSWVLSASFPMDL